MVLATGGIGKSYQVTCNSWEYTGDGHALALRAGAKLINMEFVQFHPTGMVWPPSVKGLLVTESVRGDGGILRNSEGKRFMFDYIPEFFKSETADTEEEADRWYDDKKNNRRPPELLPRDEVARAINSEIKAGRGSPHGGVFLDIASRRDAGVHPKRLPSMYHQFKELADVDITEEPMEIGPTCHYVMGGIEVDADTEQSGVTGLFAAGECSGGMHGSNRLGGNSLSDLLVFGGGPARPRGVRRRARRRTGRRCTRGRLAAEDRALAPFEDRSGGENPYTIHMTCRRAMQRSGRHHPQGGGARPSPGEDRGAQGAREARSRRGAPAVQPRLAPGDGPAQHAARLGVHREGGAGAAGVARRSHPRRLPRPDDMGHQEPGALAEQEGDGVDLAHSRCR